MAKKTIIHAPHEFPRNIKYSIVCSQLSATEKRTPAFSLLRLRHYFKGRRNGNSAPVEPVNQSFWHNSFEQDLAHQLQNILARFRPDSTCIGFTTSPEEAVNEHFLLLFTHNWQALQESLIKKGWDENKLLVMPLPESDYWAYWKHTNLYLPDKTGKVDYESTLGSAQYKTYMVQNGILDEASPPEKMVYRRQLDNTPQGISRGRQFYPFPAFATDAISKNAGKISAIRNALSDERSRQVYDMVMSGKPEERLQYAFNDNLEHLQYFEYIDIRPGDCIINAGVASGFELPFFSAHMKNKGKVHCVDPEGFDHLSAYVKPFYDANKRLFIEHRFILSDRSQPASPHHPEGDWLRKYNMISMVDLVSMLGAPRIDLVKMDIEGMEPTVVGTMEKIIKDYRPQLAIACYHGIEHFWDVPSRIIEMCNDYDFHFNIYSPTHFEAIFYAVPKERKSNAVD